MNNMNTKMKSQQLVKMAMMAALACVVGLIRFPLIPAVSFLTYDFADIPILITTFAFGPASGLLVLTVVSFIQAFLMGGDGFYGLHVHERALEYGVKVTGATVHFVNEVTDGGAIILQKAVPIPEGITAEALQKLVMEQAEHILLPQAAELLCAGRLHREGRRVVIDET